MALIDRHRDANSELNRRHGDTPISTLRSVYGSSFGAGFSPNAKLSDVIFYMSPYSLEQLAADHEAGTLGGKIESRTKTAA